MRSNIILKFYIKSYYNINWCAYLNVFFVTDENVEFEANEIYRNMILSNKELSPSVRKLMPNLRLSSLQVSDAYDYFI